MAKIDRVSRNSDIKFEIQIRDAWGTVIDPTTLKFEFSHYVFKTRAHVASWDGIRCIGCSISDNKIIIPVKNHDFGIGRIIRRSVIYYPDSAMPDGIFKDISEQKLNVEIYEL